MRKLQVIMVGATRELREGVQRELRKLGRDDIKVLDASEAPDEGEGDFGPDDIAQVLGLLDKECDCLGCRLEREARAEGRSPLMHPDIKTKDEGRRLDDIVRYPLFMDAAGNKFFFDSLFHPMHEYNLYTRECERRAQEWYDCAALLEADGSPRFQVVDYRGVNDTILEHSPGVLESGSRKANICIVGGPAFEEMMRLRAQRAH